MTTTKFAYVQIGAKDYKRLADFYIKALGFTLSANQEWLCGKEGKRGALQALCLRAQI